MTSGSPTYRERLLVPVGWWVLGALFALSLGFAVGWYLGVVAGVVGGVFPFVVAAALFLGYGRSRLQVDDAGLSAGRARIEPRWIASAVPLTAVQARERRGPRADPKAYLLLRPYIATAVEVRLADPADPAPYWLLSSRRPQRLAAALNARLTESTGPAGKAGAPGPVGSGG